MVADISAFNFTHKQCDFTFRLVKLDKTDSFGCDFYNVLASANLAGVALLNDRSVCGEIIQSPHDPRPLLDNVTDSFRVYGRTNAIDYAVEAAYQLLETRDAPEAVRAFIAFDNE